MQDSPSTTAADRGHPGAVAPQVEVKDLSFHEAVHHVSGTSWT